MHNTYIALISEGVLNPVSLANHGFSIIHQTVDNVTVKACYGLAVTHVLSTSR